jgi:methylase of polypeptide subunit release factors
LRYFWPKNIKTPIFGASDIQHSILELAQKNLYKNYCMDVELRQGSLLDPWINTIVKGARILLVANLPYIANNDPEVSVDVLENEPHTALFGG